MLNIPVIVQDISDAVLIASCDGIAVTSKSGSSYLKRLTEKNFTPALCMNNENGMIIVF